MEKKRDIDRESDKKRQRKDIESDRERGIYTERDIYRERVRE